MLYGRLLDGQGNIKGEYKYDDSGYDYISGTYKCQDTTSMMSKLSSGNIAYLVVNYDSISSDNVLNNCKVEDWYCSYNAYMDRDSYKCVPCPNGTNACTYLDAINLFDYSFCQNTSCSHCTSNNYFDSASGTCKPCPESGKSAAGNKDIKNCYISLVDGQDTTGKYTWSPKICYYK